MGYRSTVAYTIRFIPPREDKPEDGLTAEYCRDTFFTFLAEAKSKETTALCFSEGEKDYFTVDEDGLSIQFFADGVKWDDGYAEVMCHECLMGLAREWADDGDCSNPYIGGAFARIGEEAEDVTEEAWGTGDYDWCFVSRQLVVDWME